MRFAQMHPNDNVVTALTVFSPGDVIGSAEGNVVTVTESIPMGHKIALVTISEGEEIFKYGQVIGRATQTIKAGDLVHIHNVESLRGRGDLA